MSLEKQAESENFDDVDGGVNALSADDFVSRMKSLPRTALSRIQELKKLSPTQSMAIDEHPGSGGEKSASLNAEDDGYIPLKNRLTAWWHGDDVKISTVNSENSDHRSIEVSSKQDARRWTDGSISTVQQLWGKGFVEPGGAAFVKKILSLMKFESSKSVLDLSAGIGGTACILSKEHNLWMDAIEANEALATAGIQFANRHGMAKKVPIKHVDFETLELPKNKYDQIYSRESLFMVKNKKNAIKQIGKSLKSKGQVLIIDYMIGEKSNAASVEKWLNSEPERPHPWTAELYHKAMDHYGISVWTTNDLSEEYSRQIHEGWLLMVDKITNGDFDRKSIDLLIREGEIWLNRARAIEAGDLTIKRIHGVV